MSVLSRRTGRLASTVRHRVNINYWLDQYVYPMFFGSGLACLIVYIVVAGIERGGEWLT